MLTMIDRAGMSREQLAMLVTTLIARLLLSGPGPARPASAPDDGDRLLTVEEAAEKIKKSKDWLYRNHRDLSATRRIGRSLRFSEKMLNRWIASRSAA